MNQYRHDTDTAESMLKADHTWDGKRILIFSSDENLEHMANAHGLSCNGTFYSTPKQWKQILIIGNMIIYFYLI